MNKSLHSIKPLIVLLSVLMSASNVWSLETKPIMTLDIAQKMATACDTMARAKGWRPVNIAIFDEGGNLKHFQRQDGAFLGSIEIAQLKGRTSAMLPFPTRLIGDDIAYKDPKRPHGIELVPGVVVFPGGLPVKTQAGQLIGGIGVSGATSNQDEQCAQAGIDAVQHLLKD